MSKQTWEQIKQLKKANKELKAANKHLESTNSLLKHRLRQLTENFIYQMKLKDDRIKKLVHSKTPPETQSDIILKQISSFIKLIDNS